MEKAAEKCSSPVPTCGSRNIPMRRTRSGSQVKSESADARLGSRRRISDKFADEYCSRSSFRSDNRTSKGLTTGAVKRERHSRSRERDSLPTAATSRSCAGESTSRKEDPQHTGERAHARKVYSSSPDGKCGSRFHKRRLSQDRPARRNDRGRECDLDPYAHRRRR
ncbi:hypothetical protein CSUI_001807 [Cystoisospora suis]|uniref:Uncharacterized protein n=1 Tax=Cystoisospora suis TaxID=483139 RepID=A0A2C6LBM5_9APIC|nr:hypothetical protein CSUI_001807 [Cystoisospora suis]